MFKEHMKIEIYLKQLPLLLSQFFLEAQAFHLRQP